MASPPATRERFSYCGSPARCFFPAGMAALDSRVAARSVWLPAVFDTTACELLARQSDGFAPRSISDCRVSGGCDGFSLAYARGSCCVYEVRIDYQPPVGCHDGYFAAGARRIRPCCAFTWSPADRSLLAQRRSLQPSVSRAAGRYCFGSVLAVDSCPGRDCNAGDCLS